VAGRLAPWGAAALLSLACPSGAQAPAVPDPVRLVLPTGLPTGQAANDRIPVTWRQAAGSGGSRLPAVVLLHPLGEQRNRIMERFGGYLAARGISAAVMILPWHMERRPPGVKPLGAYLSLDPEIAVRSLEQALADVRVVVDWLEANPAVDSRRLGVVGVSLGAVLAHTAMGRDERLSAGVAILGGASLEDIARRSLLYRLVHPRPRSLTDQQLQRLWSVDPLAYAGRNRPRRVLMIQAARDDILPTRGARKLWEALDRPPLEWLDTNHFAPAAGADTIMARSLAHLEAAWGIRPHRRPPPVAAPTLKAGMLVGLDAPLALGLAWQAIPLAERSDHMALAHLSLGASTQGLFAAVGITLSRHVDIGVARRADGRTARPCLSIHLTL